MDFVTWAHETPNIWKVIKFHGSKPPINHVIMFVYVYLKCCSNIGLILQQHILSLDFWNRLPSVGPGESLKLGQTRFQRMIIIIIMMFGCKHMYNSYMV